ncbi:hypothetical protein SDC9_118900 [bioreactor metagenome]|uniref:Uncharacterized protein n=1 Tax=bioreactor metagenome TaxID=1076179 RepID=A0A645C3I5_9ZZZZ
MNIQVAFGDGFRGTGNLFDRIADAFRYENSQNNREGHTEEGKQKHHNRSGICSRCVFLRFFQGVIKLHLYQVIDG